MTLRFADDNDLSGLSGLYTNLCNYVILQNREELNV